MGNTKQSDPAEDFSKYSNAELLAKYEALDPADMFKDAGVKPVGDGLVSITLINPAVRALRRELEKRADEAERNRAAKREAAADTILSLRSGLRANRAASAKPTKKREKR